MRRSSKGPRSLRSMLYVSNGIILGVVLIIFICSFIYYSSVVSQYGALIENVNRANTLSMSLSTDIDQLAYDLVAGKTTPETSPHEDLFARIYSQLDTLERHSPYGENTYLIEVARRTVGTAENYIGQIIRNVETDRPVQMNEELLDEIQQVSDLLNDVVSDFTAFEIRLSEERNASLQVTNMVMSLLQVGVFAAALGFLYVNNRSMEHRINQPLQQMQAMADRIAHGDFGARIEDSQVSELNELAESMNQMAEHLDRLMQANIEKQKNLRRAEQQILQAQISPHFLYNTLDTIVALAESEQIDDVVTTTIALSNFHRISLSKGHDWIPVSQETAQIESYLTIQKIRYGMLLNYEISIDPDIMGEYMVKILLQPLVENAIYHGIKHSRKGGTVTVRGWREGDCLLFEVGNTPPGMEAEKLEALVASLKQEQSHPTKLEKPGYGLFNVNQRIRIFYEVDEGLTIESSPETGTRVCLRLPLRKEGQ